MKFPLILTTSVHKFQHTGCSKIVLNLSSSLNNFNKIGHISSVGFKTRYANTADLTTSNTDYAEYDLLNLQSFLTTISNHGSRIKIY